MLIEAEAIPYEPAELRGERLLVLAPHPDDEVIGCGGLVALHLREGRSVRIVVATDGAEAGAADLREEESRRGVALLGDGADLHFLRFPDRRLGDEASEPLREHLLAFRPDLILVPSPIEIHPDHFALARVFCELVQRDETLFADLAVTRVAFYEVGQPLRPNAIVDISGVADAKYAAIAEHQSQAALRDYAGYTRGLDAYRAMTLPAATRYAEAYYVVDLPSLRTTPLSALRRMVGTPPDVEVTRATVPVSVIMRTKDRPALLREAIDSVRASRYPCEIVVVNDGGQDVSPLPDGVKLVRHETSRGRSETANAGVRAATSAFIAFLDDDDLHYPEHLATLAAAASSSSHAAWYSDAVSAFLRPAAEGTYETHSRLRIFGQDFDRELLLIDNYIPLPTLLMPRASFLDAGGFDPEFDLFEDWDFLIRLAQRGDFLHVPRVTCEIRHFEGGSSVVLAAPEGSSRFREAKLQVWRKHAALLTNDVFAAAFERQKRRLGTLYSQLVEAKGQAEGAHSEAARLGREKAQVLAQSAALNDTINGYALRVRELEGAMQALASMAGDYEHKTLLVERLERSLEAQQRAQEALQRENEQVRQVHGETHAALELARVEIQRLSGLLDMIYHSRTWKVHTMVERMRGRG